MTYLVAILAFVLMLAGGFFALRFRDRLHLILGFSAGALIGVAFFDLLPEAIEMTGNFLSVATVLSLSALGFMIYLILDRLILFHSHCDETVEQCHNAGHQMRGPVTVLILAAHSFVDGLAVGLALQVSVTSGLVLAVAVLAHNFSDGINVVGLLLKDGRERWEAFRWLLPISLAPALGILVTNFFSLPENYLGLVLALFGGFFLYIGAAELLPESHHGHSTRWTTLATVLGMTVLYLAIKLAGG